METVLVQITNSKAYKLLEDLEDLHILKVLEKNSKPSEKYAGRLPGNITDELQSYVKHG